MTIAFASKRSCTGSLLLRRRANSKQPFVNPASKGCGQRKDKSAKTCANDRRRDVRVPCLDEVHLQRPLRARVSDATSPSVHLCPGGRTNQDVSEVMATRAVGDQ